MSDFLRILVISDLHFSGIDINNVDDKFHDKKITEFLAQSQKAKFFDRLKKICKTESDYPKAVIVAGDIVDKGGANENEFSQAVDFLNEVSKKLNIDSKRIYIVPGNHDVMWDRNLKDNEKFKNFIEATKPFTRPSIVDDQISALKVDLSGIVAGINVGLLLLVSPTFSGYSKGNLGEIMKILQNKFVGKPRENFTEKDMEGYFEAITKISEDGHLYDIAAIGTEQRNMIIEESNTDFINIAVLHHHLLPSSSIEISQFESVLDSGKVLEKLIESKYDIVITGHKHIQKLAHYYLNDSNIDVFSSPSLFSNNAGESSPGFTFLDIYDAKKSPYYTKITLYKTYEDIPPRSIELVREGRLLNDTAKICTKISPDNQLKYLNKVTPLIVDCLNWKDSEGFKSEILKFFDLSFKYSTEFLKLMAQKKIIIKFPFVDRSWELFINTINKLLDKSASNQLRVVSFNDIDYWNEALTIEDSDSSKYCEVLKTFDGEKKRIWILPKDKFENPTNPDYDKVRNIGNYMKNMGFDVYKCYEESIHFVVEKDFSIIGNVCISRWMNMDDGNRELVESFDIDDINQKNKDWERLMNTTGKKM